MEITLKPVLTAVDHIAELIERSRRAIHMSAESSACQQKEIAKFSLKKVTTANLPKCSKSSSTNLKRFTKTGKLYTSTKCMMHRIQRFRFHKNTKENKTLGHGTESLE